MGTEEISFLSNILRIQELHEERYMIVWTLYHYVIRFWCGVVDDGYGILDSHIPRECR